MSSETGAALIEAGGDGTLEVSSTWGDGLVRFVRRTGESGVDV